MSKTKIVLDSKGMLALLKSAEIEGAVAAQATAIQGKCGTGYETDTWRAPTRVTASVYTENAEAAKDCLENNTLLKAVGDS